MSGTEVPDPEAFIAAYGEHAPVVAGTMELTLGQALAFEAMMCPADKTVAQDPGKRVRYLAGMLAAAGTLRAEHYSLLPEGKNV